VNFDYRLFLIITIDTENLVKKNWAQQSIPINVA